MLLVLPQVAEVTWGGEERMISDGWGGGGLGPDDEGLIFDEDVANLSDHWSDDEERLFEEDEDDADRRVISPVSATAAAAALAGGLGLM